jgi:tetratricopeptide (TPR) repeat protein
MRLICAVFILLLVLMTSAQCQQTAEDWFNQGIALADQGKYYEAINAYDEAIRLDPNLAGVWYYKGNALYCSDSTTDEVIKAYDEAIRLKPDFAAAWYGRGYTLEQGGNYDDAIKAYDEAIRLDPNYAEAWYGRGGALHAQGKYDEALKYYDEAIRLDPNYTLAWYSSGLALLVLGRTAESDAAFAKAKELGYTDYLSDSPCV